MDQNTQKFIQEKGSINLKKKKWYRILSGLMATTVFITSYNMILPAITMEKVVCGMEEHVHSVENGCYEEQKVLYCDYGEGNHVHTEECTEVHDVLVCAKEESEGHVHNDGCYEVSEERTCGLEESEGHVHDENCQDEEGQLICTFEESTGHSHDESCLTTEKKLNCTQEEAEAHTHDETCYESKEETICGWEENHVHDGSCYKGIYKLICTKEEHTHGENCYERSDDHADTEVEEVWKQTFAHVELSDNWAEDLLAIADTQLGYKESTANFVLNANGRKRGYTRYGAWYGDTYGDWCAMFVSFCMNYAGIDRQYMPYDSNCQNWINRLEEKGLYHRTGNKGYEEPEQYMPKRGDLLFLDWDPEVEEEHADHIGIVYELEYDEEENLTNITTIEGNYNDMVTYNHYEADDRKVIGYGELPEKPIKIETEDTEVEETPVEEENKNVTLTTVTDTDVYITLIAPEDAFDVSTNELTLVATAIEDEEAKTLLEQNVSENDSENVKRNTYLFDIKIMHGKEEIQPKKPVQVSFGGISTPKDDAQIFHVDTKTDTVEEMEVTTEENGDLTMETPHFSVFGISFTVDFHNGDVTFSIAGESEILLSELFEKLGIERDIKDVVDVEFSDETLVKVEKADGDWKLISLEPFTTDETLTITFKDGEIYVIKVTDAIILGDRIDVSKGWVEFTANGAKQYVGGTNTLYGYDTSLKPTYTLYGTNNDDYLDWPISRGKVTVQQYVTIELILDNVSMEAAQTKAFEVSYSYTTITLKDNSVNKFKVLGTPDSVYRANEWNDSEPARNFGGIIGKNGMWGYLAMRCEHSKEIGHRCHEGICGVFDGDASLGGHAPVIGSYLRRYDPNLSENDGGFAYLYIEGGIYYVKASGHNAAIGTTCFLWHGTYMGNETLLNGLDAQIMSPEGSPASRNELCKDISISKARVYAYGGWCGPGIGAGYGGRVDGIRIFDGAYVYAEGGAYSPGIGSGSAEGDSHPILSDYAFHVRNLGVTGGDTVVEALGGKGLADQGVAGSEYMPGIGVGGSTRSPGYAIAGNLTNVFAVPSSGYKAIIKQGITNDRAAAQYISGAPSTDRLDIEVDRPYTLIYFSKVSKTASVNGAPDKTGTETEPVQVKEGDLVRYKISVGEIVGNTIIQGTLSDEIPEGMSLVMDPSSHSPGMTLISTGGVTTVLWENQTFSKNNSEFFFTVKVDTLPSNLVQRDFVNEAELYYSSNSQKLTITSNKTYHRLLSHKKVTIRKNVKGPVTGNENFKFEISVADPKSVPYSDFTCTMARNGVTTEATWNANHTVATITIKAGEEIQVGEIPAGYKILFKEVDKGPGKWFTNASGDGVKEKDYQPGPWGLSMEPSSWEAEIKDDLIITVTNALSEERALTLTKKITGKKTNEKFSFNLEFEVIKAKLNPSDLVLKVVDKNGTEIPNAIKITGFSLNVSLGDGDKLLVNGLPSYSFSYIKELEIPGYKVSYSVDGEPYIEGNYAYVEVDYTGDKNITFNNEAKEFDLTVKKIVQGASDDVFNFTLDLKDKDDQPVTIANGTGYTVSSGKVEFKLKKDQTITIKGIPNDTKVVLTETTYDGYSVDIYDAANPTTSISDKNAKNQTSFTMTANKSINVHNNPGIELPSTGGTGTGVFRILGSAITLAAIVFCFGKRR